MLSSTRSSPPSTYTYANEEVTAIGDLGLVVHHPKLGIALKEQIDKLGIECIVQYRERDGNQTIRHGGGETSSSLRFIQKHLESGAK